MKTLPYFRWFPADAETDEKYTTLTDEELGFFHRCLNRSWINFGLPVDPQDLAQTMRVTPKYLARVWPKVSRCFVQTEAVHPRLVNPRQEKERELAVTKARQASNAVAVRERKRTERSAGDTSPDASDDQSDDHPRAYVSVSASDSVSGKIGKGPTKRFVTDLDGQGSARFDEFWESYPRKVRKEFAASNFVAYVTISNETRVFDCLQRYLNSADVARGIVMNPDNWLYQQYRDQWGAEWPQRKETKSESTESIMAQLAEEERRAGK